MCSYRIAALSYCSHLRLPAYKVGGDALRHECYAGHQQGEHYDGDGRGVHHVPFPDKEGDGGSENVAHLHIPGHSRSLFRVNPQA